MTEDPNRKQNPQQPGRTERHPGQEKGKGTDYLQKQPRGDHDVEDEDEDQDQGGVRRAS